jgi:hypothetical protein
MGMKLSRYISHGLQLPAFATISIMNKTRSQIKQIVYDQINSRYITYDKESGVYYPSFFIVYVE